LKFSPKLAVITNIDKEHLDTYPKGLPEIIRVFRDFIKLVPANGISIVNGDDPNCRAVAKSARCPVKFFYGRRLWSGLRLIVIGDFNQMNATAAAKIAHELGINHQSIKRSLNQFQGLARRFEYKGQFNQADIFDDYAHHPSEIKATLAAVRSHFPNRKIMVIFQPHQFLRTKQLLDEFRPVFNDADQLFIGPIFEVPGRDDRSVISSKLFAESINHPSKTLVDGSYPEIAKVVQLAIRPHDVIITMGATPIYKVADLLIGLKLSANS